MAFKFVAFTTLLALASAGLAPSYPAPAYHGNYPAQPSYHAHDAYPVAAYAAPVAKIAAPVYSAPAPVYAKVAAPVYAKSAAPEPYDAHPQYNFAYDIHDEHTGDVKSQQETRDGDVVKGYYSFIESDGARRVVEYTSDPEHGFNAVVRREEGAAKPTGPASAPQGYAKAPVYHKVAAPVYAAPVAKVAYPAGPVYGAPVAKVAYPAGPVYGAPVAKVAYPAGPVYGAPVAKVAYPAGPAYPAYHH